MTSVQFKKELKVSGIQFSECYVDSVLHYRAAPLNASLYASTHGMSAECRNKGVSKTSSKKVPAVKVGDSTWPLKRLTRKDGKNVVIAQDLERLLGLIKSKRR